MEDCLSWLSAALAEEEKFSVAGVANKKWIRIVATWTIYLELNGIPCDLRDSLLLAVILIGVLLGGTATVLGPFV